MPLSRIILERGKPVREEKTGEKKRDVVFSSSRGKNSLKPVNARTHEANRGRLSEEKSLAAGRDILCPQPKGDAFGAREQKRKGNPPLCRREGESYLADFNGNRRSKL